MDADHLHRLIHVCFAQMRKCNLFMTFIEKILEIFKNSDYFQFKEQIKK